MDKERTQRVELCLHTVMSDECSVIKPRDAIAVATAMGHPAVAITDLNSVQSFSLIEKCWARQEDWACNVIYGAQVYYEKAGKFYGLNLLAKNRDGIRELYRVISSLHKAGDRRVADRQVIADNRENLLVGAMSWTGMEDAEQYDYIALIPATCPGDQEQQRKFCAAAREKQIPVVAVSNCHYVFEEEGPLKAHLDEMLGREKEENPAHLYSTEEMLQAVAYLGEDIAREVVITAPNAIAEQAANVNLHSGDDPFFSLPDDRAEVRRLCYEKLHREYGNNPPEAAVSRLEQELSALDEGLLNGLFLLIHRITDQVHNQGEPIGYRGGIGSTLVAWLMDITDTNPLPAHYCCPKCRYVEFAESASGYDLPEKVCPHCGAELVRDGHDIPYETFLLNPYLGIDINTTDGMHTGIKEAIAEHLGKYRVALAGCTGGIIEKRARLYLEEYTRREGKTLTEDERAWLLKKLTVIKDGDGQQIFGLMLLPEGMEWEDLTPLRTLETPLGSISKATHVDGWSLTHKLPKLNIVRHKGLNRLKKLFSVTGTRPEDIDYCDALRFFDPDGLAEFDTEFCRKLLTRVGEINFHNLVKISGFAHSTNGWTDNAERLLEEHPLEELISTRDDVFHTLRKYGVDRQTAFNAMTLTRKGGFDPERSVELTRILREAGVPDWYIQSMSKVKYLFPKAHAVHYVKIALALQWFKVHYPDAFWDVTQ